MSTEIKWHQISLSIQELDFNDEQIATAYINNKKICIGKYNNQLYAFDYKCPHANGIMAHGYISAKGEVVCPLHHYKFSIETGKNTTGQGYSMKTYPIEIKDEGVFVGETIKKWGFF
jgi:nitrite reductase/ring-hydroxylating ferredoxin subunit